MRKLRKLFQDNAIVRGIWKTLITIVELFFVVIALIIIIQRATNNEKSFFGYRIFSVVTGSMQPEYSIGEVIVAKEKKPEELEVGDNITYLGNYGSYNGKIVTHSIVKIDKDENGHYKFHTKGIANTEEDPIVDESQVYGKIIYNMKLITVLYKIMSNKYGLYFVIILPVTICGFIRLIRSKDKIMKEEQKDGEQIYEQEKKKR